jgi:hypothetical protein
MNKNRHIIFNKYNGRCAYCGCALPERGWHVDELLPVERIYKEIKAHWKNKVTGEKRPSDNFGKALDDPKNWTYVPSKVIADGCRYPERFAIENQNPSCASCNINKHSMSLEQFRELISGFMKHLNEISTQYKIAKRYGLVIEDVKPVVFYFETQEKING